jgi:hypothetical protein
MVPCILKITVVCVRSTCSSSGDSVLGESEPLAQYRIPLPVWSLSFG